MHVICEYVICYNEKKDIIYEKSIIEKDRQREI